MYAFYCLYDAKVGLVIAWVYFLASLPRKSMEWFLSDLQPCTLRAYSSEYDMQTKGKRGKGNGGSPTGERLVSRRVFLTAHNA